MSYPKEILDCKTWNFVQVITFLCYTRFIKFHTSERESPAFIHRMGVFYTSSLIMGK